MSTSTSNRLTRLLGVITLAAGLTACGFTAPSHNPGFVSFDGPGHRGLKHDTTVSLGPRVLRFAANHTDEDPETQALLRSIDGVRVQVYEMTSEADLDAILADMGERGPTLFDEAWSPIVKVKEDQETVFLYLKQDGETILGLAVIAVDAEEFVFVNVMGNIDPEQLAAIASHVPYTDVLAEADLSDD